MGIFDIFKKKEDVKREDVKKEDIKREEIKKESKSTESEERNFIVDLFNGNNDPIKGSVEFVYLTHQRFEHGSPRPEQLNINRTIRIEKNISGDIGYTISIRDGATDRVTLSPKPMKIVSHTSGKVVLKGYGYDKFAVGMGAPMSVASFECYAISLFLKDNVVYKCISHWLDRDINIEYYDKDITISKNVLSDNIRRQIKSVDGGCNMDKSEVKQPYINGKIAQRVEAVKGDLQMCQLMKLVDLAISYEERGGIPNLQQILYQIGGSIVGKGRGMNNINFPDHNKLCKIYVYLLKYDWQNDSDLLEVCVENGFYCHVKYMMSEVEREEDMLEAYFVLFLLLVHGGKYFESFVTNIVFKSPFRDTSTFSEADYQGGAKYIINNFLSVAYLGMASYCTNHQELFTKYIESDVKFTNAVISCKNKVDENKLPISNIRDQMSYIWIFLDRLVRNT